MSEGNEEKRPACPECGSQLGIPIVYGLPSEETVEAAESGQFAIGGCVVYKDWSPKFQCKSCGNRWGFYDSSDGPMGEPLREEARRGRRLL